MRRPASCAYGSPRGELGSRRRPARRRFPLRYGFTANTAPQLSPLGNSGEAPSLARLVALGTFRGAPGPRGAEGVAVGVDDEPVGLRLAAVGPVAETIEKLL